MRPVLIALVGLFLPVAVSAVSVAPSLGLGSLILITSTDGPGSDIILFPTFPNCYNFDGQTCGSVVGGNISGLSLDTIFGVSIAAGTYTLIEDPTGDCFGATELSQCTSLPGVSTVQVVVTDHDVSLTNSETAPGGGFFVHFPGVKMKHNLTGKIVSGVVPIEYTAWDDDDTVGRPQFGLRKDPPPVDIYYGYKTPADTYFFYSLLGENQLATGTFLWDTSKFSDGQYRLLLRSWAGDGNYGEDKTEDFRIDNKPPRFTLTVNPSFTRGEPVKIVAESSEPLKALPVISVTQYGHEPIEIKLEGKPEERIFTGRYEVVKGFDGPAALSIKGEDYALNIGTTILGTDSFAVGFAPPPAPALTEPEATSTMSTTISIAGSGVNAIKVVALLNGRERYVDDSVSKGNFRIENIPLHLEDRGVNTIVISTYDAAGGISAPKIFKILRKSAPKVTLLEPVRRRLILKGEIPIRWSSADANEDSLTHVVELSNDRGATWNTLARGLKTTEFKFDSTSVPDGANYMVRVAASDGELKGSASSNAFSISNGLPTILLDASGDFFITESSKTFKGSVESKQDRLVKVEFSVDGGKYWEKIVPNGGSWDRPHVSFELPAPFIKRGRYGITIRGTTNSGREVFNSQRLNVAWDDEAPYLSAVKFPATTITKKYLSLKGTAGDSVSGIQAVEYSIDDSVWYRGLLDGPSGLKSVSFSISHPDPLPDGEHKVVLRAIDRAQNISSLREGRLVLDATPPTIGSFLIRSNGSIIFPGMDGAFVIGQDKNTFILEMSVAGRPKSVKLKVNESSFYPVFDKDKNLWRQDLSIGNTSTTKVWAVSEDELGNRSEKLLGRFERRSGFLTTLPMTPNSATESWISRLLKSNQ